MVLVDAGAHHGRGLGKLGPGVGAEGAAEVGPIDGDEFPLLEQDPGHVGQVVLALSIVVVEHRQRGVEVLPPERVHARRHLPDARDLRIRRAVLREVQEAVAVADDPREPLRVGELDRLHGRGRFPAPVTAENRLEHRPRDERLVAGEDDHVVGGPDRVLRHEDRVTGAERGPLVDEDR